MAAGSATGRSGSGPGLAGTAGRGIGAERGLAPARERYRRPAAGAPAIRRVDRCGGQRPGRLRRPLDLSHLGEQRKGQALHPHFGQPAAGGRASRDPDCRRPARAGRRACASHLRFPVHRAAAGAPGHRDRARRAAPHAARPGAGDAARRPVGQPPRALDAGGTALRAAARWGSRRDFDGALPGRPGFGFASAGARQPDPGLRQLRNCGYRHPQRCRRALPADAVLVARCSRWRGSDAHLARWHAQPACDPGPPGVAAGARIQGLWPAGRCGAGGRHQRVPVARAPGAAGAPAGGRRGGAADGAR